MPLARVSPRRRRAGFTIIELLVVISIMGLLIALLMPALMQARRTAERVACAASLKQLGAGWVMYVDDFPDALPPARSLPRPPEDAQPGDVTIMSVLAGYIDEPRAFHCPSDDRNYFQRLGTSYEYALAFAMELVPDNTRVVAKWARENPSIVPILSDAEVFHPSGADPDFYQTMYYDGRVGGMLDEVPGEFAEEIQ